MAEKTEEICCIAGGENWRSYLDFALGIIREAKTQEHRNRCITVGEK